MFKRTLAAFFVIVLTCGTVACNDPSQRGDASDNPKEGVVRVFPDNNVPSFYKRCDGTTSSTGLRVTAGVALQPSLTVLSASSAPVSPSSRASLLLGDRVLTIYGIIFIFL